MKRKLIVLVASAAMLLTFAPAVSAASVGSCGDSGTSHYNKGNVKPSSEVHNISSVKANVAIGPSSQFSMCVPNDNAGANGPFVAVELYNDYLPYGAWVQVGIVRCQSNPSLAYCTGSPRLITEWHEALTNVSLVYDIGPASYNTVYKLDINLNSPNQTAEVRVNSLLKKVWNVGSQLNTGDDPDAYWFTELHDRGDGLGSNSAGNSVDVGQMQYIAGGTLWNRTSSCNYSSGGNESNCVVNGANGLYFYTVN